MGEAGLGEGGHLLQELHVDGVGLERALQVGQGQARGEGLLKQEPGVGMLAGMKGISTVCTRLKYKEKAETKKGLEQESVQEHEHLKVRIVLRKESKRIRAETYSSCRCKRVRAYLSWKSRGKEGGKGFVLTWKPRKQTERWTWVERYLLLHLPSPPPSPSFTLFLQILFA